MTKAELGASTHCPYKRCQHDCYRPCVHAAAMSEEVFGFRAQPPFTQAGHQAKRSMYIQSEKVEAAQLTVSVKFHALTLSIIVNYSTSLEDFPLKIVSETAKSVAE